MIIYRCSFRMHIQIKKASTRKRKDDKLLDTHPCIIVVTGEHNHAACAKALKELRVLPEVEKEFFEYFHRGMGAAEAQRYHRLKLDLGSEFWMEHARADTNPTLRSVQYMREKWAKATVGGYNDEDMFDALKRYAATTKSVIEVERSSSGSFCVALVTPFMKRVHALREAGEVVFVDATASVDRLNTAVLPLLCCSPAGALPLGVVFSSSQDEAQLTTGFQLLQKAVGSGAFNGRGHPSAFITDNCDAERRALRTVWPEAEQFLCVFHVLQQVWRWLLDSKHGVPKDKRQELMRIMQKLVYAESPERFQALLAAEDITHEGFARYMEGLIERRAEWAIAYRQGSALRGNHTNNYAEATMCIIKDIVMNR
ncbi:PKS-NRPS hybrid synthetase cheA-like isoform X2 [Amphibalanus amphitrite]|uniref:PKS-NRPS hybrid synthetase cheA-like isoform X2 n=1 Tax=Amphibalanus amphitrite TaxID=1232801 RepID=UPI001C921E71|nr:PKS-NRPS hybrid synthetase cheA-like isoform X2 [Amphibalanus amphitrite]